MAKPTNSDIMREIKSVNTILKDHEDRIRPLENWKIAYEAAVKALEGAPSRNVNTLNKDFVNVVLKFIGLLTTFLGVVYLLIQELSTRQ